MKIHNRSQLSSMTLILASFSLLMIQCHFISFCNEVLKEFFEIIGSQPGLQHLNASLQMRGGQGGNSPNVGIPYAKQDGGVLKNLRSSESFATHNVTSQSGGTSSNSVNPAKEGYNPTPIQRPQGK